MEIQLNLVQRVRLSLMLGAHRCEDIKSVTEMSALYKILKVDNDTLAFNTRTIGDNMVLLPEAEALSYTLEFTKEQATTLKNFINNWKGGWSVTDADWVLDLMNKL